MLWLALFLVVIGVAVYIVDKKIKAKFEDKFNPKDWDLPNSVELPAELMSTSAAQKSVAEKLIASQSGLSVSTPAEKLRYQKKPSALSHEQTQMYKALRSALAGEYTLLTNVSVADTLAVIETSNALIAQVAVKNIAAKQFDFVVCENTQLTAVCAIVLGENLEPLLVTACESAQLPLARFRVQANYDVAAIRTSIFQAIGGLDITERSPERSVLDITEGSAERSSLEITDIKSPEENSTNNEQAPAAIANEEISTGNGIDLKLCPSCSAVMLKRRAKNGADAGKMFWICSTYPKCRGMLLVK
jgi:hypothetical protein